MRKLKYFPVLTALAMGFTLVGCKSNDNSGEEIETLTSTTITSEVSDSTTITSASGVLKEETELKKEYNYEDIRIIIENNNNLTRDEKDFLNKFQFVFDEYHGYMNLELIKKRLQTLSTEYISALEYREKYGRIVGAEYDMKENKMRFVGRTCFKEVDELTFIHEYFHVLQDSNHYGFFTTELSNCFFVEEMYSKLYYEQILPRGELVNNNSLNLDDERECLAEKFNSYVLRGGYYSYKPLYDVLAEMLPKDSLIAYQFNPNFPIILKRGIREATGVSSYEDLTRIDNLINAINNLRKREENDYVYYDPDAEIYSELDYFYEKAKHIHIKQDLLLNLQMTDHAVFSFTSFAPGCYNNIPDNLEGFLCNNIGLDDLEYSTCLNKLILSDNQPSTYILGYNKNEEPIELTIDEELQSQYVEYIRFLNEENIQNKKKEKVR